MYADYSYYSKVYHGKLSENDYTPYAEKAGAYIDNQTDFLFEKNGLPAEGSSLARRLMTCLCDCGRILPHRNGSGIFKDIGKSG